MPSPISLVFIDEYQSPKELAEYIRLLDSNDQLYMEYFTHKQPSQNLSAAFISTCSHERWCDLCSSLENFSEMIKEQHVAPVDNSCGPNGYYQKFSTDTSPFITTPQPTELELPPSSQPKSLLNYLLLFSCGIVITLLT